MSNGTCSYSTHLLNNSVFIPFAIVPYWQPTKNGRKKGPWCHPCTLHPHKTCIKGFAWRGLLHDYSYWTYNDGIDAITYLLLTVNVHSYIYCFWTQHSFWLVYMDIRNFKQRILSVKTSLFSDNAITTEVHVYDDFVRQLLVFNNYTLHWLLF